MSGVSLTSPLPILGEPFSPPDRSFRGEIHLAPEESFPSDLTASGLGELQVLHSRLCCQLAVEYLRPEGPHPVSLDRHEELVAELGSRESKTTTGTGGACGGR